MSWNEDRKELLEALTELRQELYVEKQLTAQLEAQLLEIRKNLPPSEEISHPSDANSYLTAGNEVCECGNGPNFDAKLAHEQYTNLYNNFIRLTLFLDKFLPKVAGLLKITGPTDESQEILDIMRKFNAKTRLLREKGEL